MSKWENLETHKKMVCQLDVPALSIAAAVIPLLRYALITPWRLLYPILMVTQLVASAYNVTCILLAHQAFMKANDNKFIFANQSAILTTGFMAGLLTGMICQPESADTALASGSAGSLVGLLLASTGLWFCGPKYKPLSTSTSSKASFHHNGTNQTADALDSPRSLLGRKVAMQA